jgi:hypothetical protein
LVWPAALFAIIGSVRPSLYICAKVVKVAVESATERVAGEVGTEAKIETKVEAQAAKIEGVAEVEAPITYASKPGARRDTKADID